MAAAGMSGVSARKAFHRRGDQRAMRAAAPVERRHYPYINASQAFGRVPRELSPRYKPSRARLRRGALARS